MGVRSTRLLLFDSFVFLPVFPCSFFLLFFFLCYLSLVLEPSVLPGLSLFCFLFLFLVVLSLLFCPLFVFFCYGCFLAPFSPFFLFLVSVGAVSSSQLFFSFGLVSGFAVCLSACPLLSPFFALSCCLLVLLGLLLSFRAVPILGCSSLLHFLSSSLYPLSRLFLLYVLCLSLVNFISFLASRFLLPPLFGFAFLCSCSIFFVFFPSSCLLASCPPSFSISFCRCFLFSLVGVHSGSFFLYSLVLFFLSLLFFYVVLLRGLATLFSLVSFCFFCLLCFLAYLYLS